MPEALFDLSAEYDEMLNRGIRLSGESRDFFVEGRLTQLRSHLPDNLHIARILDFGCGTGTSSARLAALFPNAEVHGVDTAIPALDHARSHYGSPRVSFGTVDDLASTGTFDLCYVNGVFHHILPADRAGALCSIRDRLRSGGYFAMFENNPWNPGTRMVMARIPFDRDAQTIPIFAAVKMFSAAGFTESQQWWTLFYFPRSLRFLRFVEPLLAPLPLGAQYCVLAARS